MNRLAPHDPYAGNILVGGLTPIRSREEALADLLFLPQVPKGIEQMPRHLRMHYVVRLRDFHIPGLEEARLSQTVDLMVRDSYRYRDPNVPRTWGIIGGEGALHKTPRAPAMVSAGVGHSGTGKTEAALRILRSLGPQVIRHESFPRLEGEHFQLVFQSVDVPATGRSNDLADQLMRNFDLVMDNYVQGWSPRFSTPLARTRRDGPQMLAEWQQVALAHFLGLLHLDEVQNFFKLPSLEKRRRKIASVEERELAIIEDQNLKWILTLTNTLQIPILLSGTPDGMGALMRRLANVQRFVGGGYHVFSRFSSPDDPTFFGVGAFLTQLGRYQYVQKPMKIDHAFAELVIQLTAGIQRLVVALWVAAHRVAFERKEDSLRIEDFERAAATYLAPIAPAVKALLSSDPEKMARYEDLVRRDDNFWATFWASMAAS